MPLSTPHSSPRLFVSFALGAVLCAGPLIADAPLDLDRFDWPRARTVLLPPSAAASDAALAAPAAVDMAVLDFDRDGVDDVVVLRRGGAGEPGRADLAVRFGNLAAVYPHYPSTRSFQDGRPFTEMPMAVEAPGDVERILAFDVDFDGYEELLALNGVDRPVAWARSSAELSAGGLSPLPSTWPGEAAGALRDVQNELFSAAVRNQGEAFGRIRVDDRAGRDLLTLDGTGRLVHVPAVAGVVFTVNSSDNTGDSYDLDGLCDTANDPTADPPVPPSGECTLRAAIEQSNATAGPNTVRFAVGGGGPVTIGVGGGALEITDELTLDGTSQPGFAGEPLVQLAFTGGGAFPGLAVQAEPVLIRGFVISGFTTEGIAVFADGATIETCYVGTDLAGDTAAPNFRGIGLGGANSVVGGAFPEAGNLVSGNTAGGISVGGSGHEVSRNTIGTNRAGTVALGNGIVGSGVLVTGTFSRVLSNVISGNFNVGARIQGDTTVISGNTIGTNRAGDAAVPNGGVGVFLVGITGATVVANQISGNSGDGVLISGSESVSVWANFIGTDKAGLLAVPNTLHGVHLRAEAGTRTQNVSLGGPFSFFGRLGNVISGNGDGEGHGVLIEGDTRAVDVLDNRIGTDVTGTAPLGNVDDGIRIVESSFVAVGPYEPSIEFIPNVIAFNGGAGISVLDPDGTAGAQDASSNSLMVNSVFDNGGLAIDLAVASTAPNGPTANDAGDGDFGPNRLQNFPEITQVTEIAPGTTRIEGTLDSEPNLPFDIRFFSNPACDGSGFGEARTYLGRVRVTTDGAGAGSFMFDTTTQVNVLTATATNFESDHTSELSPCDEPTGGRLGNRVFEDLEIDGLQDPTEPGIEGVVVNLRNASGTSVLETTVTDPAGFYSFDGLPTGTYRIEVVAPEGFLETLPDVGLDDSVDSDLQVGLITEPFNYTAGTVDLTRDGGLTSLIFGDGFESGDTSRWSATIGGV
ncbi:MAG: SdrD B-like domain-containing protein [Acidobacteriota bacterium]